MAYWLVGSLALPSWARPSNAPKARTARARSRVPVRWVIVASRQEGNPFAAIHGGRSARAGLTRAAWRFPSTYGAQGLVQRRGTELAGRGIRAAGPVRFRGGEGV